MFFAWFYMGKRYWGKQKDIYNYDNRDCGIKWMFCWKGIPKEQA